LFSRDWSLRHLDGHIDSHLHYSIDDMSPSRSPVKGGGRLIRAIEQTQARSMLAGSIRSLLA